MNHRERVLAALDHRETDRVRVDLGSTIVTTACRASWGGGIDVQQVLPFATHEEIEREVRDSIETLGRDGGYVFCAAHNIQPDVSPDPIDVMYRPALGHQPAGRAS
jgi:uroporphyrinogen-III decarboxylase